MKGKQYPFLMTLRTKDEVHRVFSQYEQFNTRRFFAEGFSKSAFFGAVEGEMSSFSADVAFPVVTVSAEVDSGVLRLVVGLV